MKTFCNKKAIPMLFILSLLLIPAVSFAEYVGSFSRIEGRVDLLRAGATTVVPARQGDGVSTGDIIRTKSDGRAEILFKDDTTVTVASETRLKIDEYTFNPDNSRSKGMLSLLRGKLRAAVSKVKAGLIPVSLGSSTFSISTPTTVAGVRGSVLFVFYERGITGVVFKEGHGFVYNINMPERIVDISAGQATFILKDDAPPLPPRPATDAELAVHTKDTTFSEKPKEKKEEGEQPKEEKKEIIEAKAEKIEEDKENGDEPKEIAKVEEKKELDVAEHAPIIPVQPVEETAGFVPSPLSVVTPTLTSQPPPDILPITVTTPETLTTKTPVHVNVNFPQ